MIFRMLPLLLVLFSATSQAGQFPEEIVEYIDSTKVVAFVDADDIDSTVAWQPFDGAPPLTVSAALKAIRDQLGGSMDLSHATLAEIELMPIPHHKSHWNYLVKMNADINDKQQARYFIVLMNGKIIAGMGGLDS